MNRHRRSFVLSSLALALVASGCGSGDPGDTATTVAAAATTTVAATTTMATTTTSSTTTTTTTTTTTLSPEVRPPEPIYVYRWTLDQTARVSAPGQIDEILDTTLDVVVDDEAADMHMSMGILGITLEVQIIMIGDESWVKEDKKPWRVNDGIWSLDDSGLLGVGEELPVAAGSGSGGESNGPAEVSYGEERDFYESLSNLDFEVVDLRGVTARKYVLPTELHVTALHLAEALEVGDEVFLTETSDVELWLDASSNQIIRLTGELRGSVELVSGDPDEYDPDAVARLSVEVEVTDIDSDKITVEAPEVPESDAPDGYLLLDENVTGASLLYPEDWVFVDAGLGGFMPGATIPFILLDLESGSSINMIREDASAMPGLTLEEYVDLSMRGITLMGIPMEIVTRRPFDLADGTPAVLLESVLDDDDLVTTQIIFISGSYGYVLTLTEPAGMSDAIGVALMDSLRLEPSDGTNS